MNRRQFAEEFKEVKFCLGERFKDKYSDDKNLATMIPDIAEVNTLIHLKT